MSSNIEMGSNDLYLIKKLKESGINLDKLDTYLRKIYLTIKGLNKGSVSIPDNVDF